MRKLSLLLCLFASAAFAQTNNSKDPTWWDKYQYILNNGPLPAAGATNSVSVGGNVDVSNDIPNQTDPTGGTLADVPGPSEDGVEGIFVATE
jgi:hypothetical protein